MSNLNVPHRTFSVEFKLLIINKYLSGDKSQFQLAKEYKLDERMISRWIHKFQSDGVDALKDRRGKHGNQPGRPKTKYDTELEQLRAENMRLKGENFLLKKLKEYLNKQK